MIDKLDVRIPSRTPFTPGFHEIYRGASEKKILKPSEYYTTTGDFRSFGYQVRLHMYAKRGRSQRGKNSPDHKLELYDTAEMSLEQMLHEIRRVFICNPLKLEMVRRDICVDVEGVSLEWFKTHTRVEFKRNVREIGYMTVLGRHGQTFYMGVKPNQFRFYDKVAERLYGYEYESRRARKGGLLMPTFEEKFGHPKSATITRVERQYGGSQCGGTLKSLFMLDRSNPFESLKFLEGSTCELSPVGMDCTQYWATQHLQRMAKEHGIQYVRAHMSETVGSKNLKKQWERHAPFLAPSNDGPGIDEEMLNQLYLKSTKRQLFG